MVPAVKRVAGIHQTAVVAPTVRIHEDVYVGAYAVIEPGAVVHPNAQILPHTVIGEDVVVGEYTEIGPNSTVLARTIVGARCKIGAGTVIGSDGFGHIPDEPVPIRFPHFGRVIIEDDVEIGANVCIDRGALTDTVIERGARLDNLVQVGHGARVGASSLLAAFVGLAGRAVVGRRVQMGGRSSLKRGCSTGRQ